MSTLLAFLLGIFVTLSAFLALTRHKDNTTWRFDDALTGEGNRSNGSVSLYSGDTGISINPQDDDLSSLGL